ncbi:diguanylate cyclase (GGDEF)-like protein [Conyzicola lurida]|uniref:Diguanylate cyclase (GGDEF)-like protein n=1 Tax=Conyzicola lurida TaxID=1172621 RepID=A0A841AME5_9MICO|nr:diguanylate cyclase (GGDEF)-like protein [Conyzicola lurida]
MQLDLLTLLYASGLIVVSSGTSFIISTLVHRADLVARLWSLGFVAGMLATIAYAIWAASPGAWWVIGIGNAALVFALGAMWSGCRAFNERPPRLWVVALVSALVFASAFVRGSEGGAWAGAAEMFIAIAVFAGLASSETLRARLRVLVNGRILAVVFAGVSLFYLVRCGVILILGQHSDVFTVYFGTPNTTLVNIVFITLASIAMSVLQATRGGDRTLTAGPEVDPALGFTTRAQFEGQAVQWLRRAERRHESLALVVLEVDNLEHVNIALGSDYGDRTVDAVGMVARDHVPTTSLIGRISSRRFAILTPTPPVGEPRQLGERVLTALAEAPIDPNVGARPVAVFGVVTTDGAGYEYDELRSIAERRATTRS